MKSHHHKIDVNELLAIHQELVSNPAAIDEYRNTRRAILASDAHCEPDQAMMCMTSGMSSGVRRRYRYGPSFWALYETFEHIKFGHVPRPYIEIFIVKFKTSGHVFDDLGADIDVRINQCHTFPGMHKIMCAINNCGLESLKRFLLKIGSGYRSIILSMNPLTAHRMLQVGMNIFTLDPRIFLLHFEGERFDEDLVQAASVYDGVIMDSMRVWNEGTTFYTCRFGKKHLVDLFFDYQINNNHEITTTTDLYNLAERKIDAPCSDKIRISYDRCECGQSSIVIGINRDIDVSASIFNIRLSYEFLDFVFFGALNKVGVKRDGRSMHIAVIEPNQLIFVYGGTIIDNDKLAGARRVIEDIIGKTTSHESVIDIVHGKSEHPFVDHDRAQKRYTIMRFDSVCAFVNAMGL